MIHADATCPSCTKDADRQCGFTEKAMGPWLWQGCRGVSRPTARRAMDLYEAGGMKAIVPRSRGTVNGSGRILTPEQEKHIRTAIRDRRPEQLNLDLGLWGRGGAHPAGVRSEAWIELHRKLFEAMGLHTAEAHQEGLRTEPRDGEEVA